MDLRMDLRIKPSSDGGFVICEATDAGRIIWPANRKDPILVMRGSTYRTYREAIEALPLAYGGCFYPTEQRLAEERKRKQAACTHDGSVSIDTIPPIVSCIDCGKLLGGEGGE